MKKNLSISMLAAWLLIGAAMPARAQEIDAQIEGAKQCTKNLARYERQFGIPMHLLSAISATESGRYHKGLKITLPWPWTINVEGQGHYYDTKQQAIAAVRQFQAQGRRSIDIGCMQVNLIHHPNAFASLDEAFDPEANVAYGASFLRSLYEENKSWKSASASYHSRTPARGGEYVGRVYDRWTNIIDRVREAKANVPQETVAALSEKSRPVELTLAASEPKSVKVRPKLVNDSVTRMNAISVRSVEDRVASRDNGVLVIRPKVTVANDVAPIPTEIADNGLALQPPKVIHVADARPIPAVASGPRFIFDN